MNITVLILGFILGAVSTIVFMSTLKSSAFSPSGADESGESRVEKKLTYNPILGVFVLVPILAGLVYWKTGSPNAAGVSAPAVAMPTADANHEPTVPTEMGTGHEMGDLSNMAQKLADKLAKNPQNGDGWVLLAHSYVELKEHKNAVGAFSKAVELIPNDPQLLADYADALAVTNNGNFVGKSTELVEKALKIDPNHPKALLLAGTIAFNNADYNKAIISWQHLEPLVPNDDPMLSKQLEANITEAKLLLAKK